MLLDRETLKGYKAARDFDKPLPDLSDPKVAAEGDTKLFQRISRGRKPMPRFDNSLSEEQRWHLVNYIKTLSDKGGGDPVKALATLAATIIVAAMAAKRASVEERTVSTTAPVQGSVTR